MTKFPSHSNVGMRKTVENKRSTAVTGWTSGGRLREERRQTGRKKNLEEPFPQST